MSKCQNSVMIFQNSVIMTLWFMTGAVIILIDIFYSYSGYTLFNCNSTFNTMNSETNKEKENKSDALVSGQLSVRPMFFFT